MVLLYRPAVQPPMLAAKHASALHAVLAVSVLKVVTVVLTVDTMYFSAVPLHHVTQQF